VKLLENTTFSQKFLKGKLPAAMPKKKDKSMFFLLSHSLVSDGDAQIFSPLRHQKSNFFLLIVEKRHLKKELKNNSLELR
jgi:hypothetical protein